MSRKFDEYIGSFPDEENLDYYLERDGIRYRRLYMDPDYYISDDGYVLSYAKDFPRVLTTWKNQYGHEYTRIKGRTISIHREVAKAFVPNYGSDNVVRHLDDNPHNNGYDNLAWGSQHDNVQDMLNHGRDFHKAVLCKDTGEVFRSCSDASKKLGVSRSAITLACQGKNKTVKGYKLRYLEDQDDCDH